MRFPRAGLVAVGGGVAVVAGWAGASFACTPAPRVSSLLPESASPGSTVVVEGQAVTGAPVDIRWNGVKGKRLAVAAPDASGGFSVPVQVPDAAPGVYSFTLVDNSASIGRMAFEVTAGPGSATTPAAKLWPSMTARPSMASPATGGPNTAGVALLGVGLVVLGAGTAAAMARRRRVLAA